MLATCGIRWPELACENTSCCLLLLANSPEEEYNRKHASLIFTKGNIYCAEDSHLHHMVDRLLSSVAQPPLRRLDQTEHHLSPCRGR